MDSKELHHIREFLQGYTQRLYGLELKEALQGINMPVEILIEMENLRGKPPKHAFDNNLSKLGKFLARFHRWVPYNYLATRS